MKICVIGYKGIVGGATIELFKRLWPNYEIIGTDKGDFIPTAEIYFICIPEDEVETVVKGIILSSVKISPVPTIVIRSTTTPGTCKRLTSLLKFHISHNPEFIREATALQDEFNPDRIVIGQCCQMHGVKIASLYRPLLRRFIITDSTTSELVKLASNCYLATIISYWNTIEEIALETGVSGHQVGMIASMDHRISTYGARFHNKYGGMCLPKDMQQLIKFSKDLGIKPDLLEAVEKVNSYQ